MLEALEAKGKTPEGFFAELVEAAYTPEDPARLAAMREIAARLEPVARAVYPSVEFPLDTSKPPAHQINQVLSAVANHALPADVGAVIVGMIRDSMEVKEISELLPIIESMKQESAELKELLKNAGIASGS